MSPSRFSRYQLPAILWALFIFATSSVPSSEIPSISILRFDKLIHAGVFFVLCALTYRALKHQIRFPSLQTHAHSISLVITMGYGMIDEFHQFFIPGRSVDPFDLLADSIGGVLFVLSHWAVIHLRQRKLSRGRS